MILYAFFGLFIYLVGASLISLIPHQLAFKYNAITVRQASVNEILKYNSVIAYRRAGHYIFRDKLSCDLGDGLERIALSETEGDYIENSGFKVVPWTWRENNPFVIPEGTTFCVLNTKVIYKFLGVIPLTQSLKLEHEVE